MEKTKLGLSISLLGGGLYFIGLLGLTPLLLAAGYVLIAEDNQWLKRVAVKAVAVVLLFGILLSGLSLLTDSSNFLRDLVILFDGTINMVEFDRVVRLIRVAISFLQTLCLLMLGFKAMKMSDVKVGPVDGAINKNM